MNIKLLATRSRMNCVVERRRTEEVVDAPARNVQLPFGMNVSTDPKKQKITGERIAIFCDNGNEKCVRYLKNVPNLSKPPLPFPGRKHRLRVSLEWWPCMSTPSLSSSVPSTP